MAQRDGNTGRVLIVEDHLPTSRLMATAFQEVASGVTCIEVGTAEKALEFLTQTGNPSDTPEIVLLDLELPNNDGFAVLRTLKNDPELRRKPVVVMSATQSQEAINRCYELHARTFISKPDEWEEFVEIAEAVSTYWFAAAECPATTPFARPEPGDTKVEIE